MEKIYTAQDKAIEKGFPSYRQLLTNIAVEKKWKLTNKINKASVFARVDFGRWLANCTCEGCNGVNYVDPADPVFFCFSCQNNDVNGDFKSVTFPKNREEVEAELLKRNVIVPPKYQPTDAALNSIPKIPGLVRSWNPNETIDKLQKQREFAESLF